MSTSSATQYSYFRQGFVPEAEAVLPIQNQSFLYGTSLFEGIRGYWVPEQNAIVVFRAKEHFERLLSNANIFGMIVPETVEECLQIVVDLIQKNGLKTDTYLRPTIFKDGSGSSYGLRMIKMKVVVKDETGMKVVNTLLKLDCLLQRVPGLVVLELPEVLQLPG